jgi:hypothetical protein
MSYVYSDIVLIPLFYFRMGTATSSLAELKIQFSISIWMEFAILDLILGGNGLTKMSRQSYRNCTTTLMKTWKGFTFVDLILAYMIDEWQMESGCYLLEAAPETRLAGDSMKLIASYAAFLLGRLKHIPRVLNFGRC